MSVTRFITLKEAQARREECFQEALSKLVFSANELIGRRMKENEVECHTHIPAQFVQPFKQQLVNAGFVLIDAPKGINQPSQAAIGEFVYWEVPHREGDLCAQSSKG
jgi:hypothetical protein